MNKEKDLAIWKAERELEEVQKNYQTALKKNSFHTAQYWLKEIKKAEDKLKSLHKECPESDILKKFKLLSL